jgi:hypothetical protein
LLAKSTSSKMPSTSRKTNSAAKQTTQKSRTKKRSQRVPFDIKNPEHNSLVSANLSDDETSWKFPASPVPETLSISNRQHPTERKRKRKKSPKKSSSKSSLKSSKTTSKSTSKSKKLRSELSKFQGSTILFGNDDINASDLDEHGNIKNLIDYSDPQEYAVYESEMKRREQQEQAMVQRPHIIFSESGDDEEFQSDSIQPIRKKREMKGKRVGNSFISRGARGNEVPPSDDEKEEYAAESEDTEDTEDTNIEDITEDDQDSENEEQENIQQGMRIIIPYLFGGASQPENDTLSDFQARVAASNLPDSCKQIVLKRLDNTDPDKPKLIEWIETLLNIPFGRLAVSPVTINDSLPKIQAFFDQTIKQFNNTVYGLVNVKQQIIDYLGQFIAAGSEANPRTLALCGGPGIGKTYLVRHGIADALGRPLRVINMGGIKDSAHMCGFEYSYANARHGVIIQALIEKQVMNPIILFEEVDKISETRDGQDIQNVLMHLTDPEQNKAFQDKYFSGIDIDISKAILVFTLNDPSALSPILLNRLHLINVPDPNREDRIQIAKLHMLPEIFKNVNMTPNSVTISDKICGYLLDHYSKEDKGLRTLKGCLETIMLRLNMIRFIGNDLSGKLKLSFPITLNTEIVDTILQPPNQPSLSMYL